MAFQIAHDALETMNETNLLGITLCVALFLHILMSATSLLTTTQEQTQLKIHLDNELHEMNQRFDKQFDEHEKELDSLYKTMKDLSVDQDESEKDLDSLYKTMKELMTGQAELKKKVAILEEYIETVVDSEIRSITSNILLLKEPRNVTIRNKRTGHLLGVERGYAEDACSPVLSMPMHTYGNTVQDTNTFVIQGT